MYKWPQGRIIRTICLLVTALIACDFAYSGAWAQYEAYSTASASGMTRQLVLVFTFSAISLAVLIAGVVAIGFKPRSVDFLIEVEQEMARVTWPSFQDLVRSTVFIAIMIVVLGLGIFAVDWININILFAYILGSKS